jgi:hypothetical protein
MPDFQNHETREMPSAAGGRNQNESNRVIRGSLLFIFSKLTIRAARKETGG